MLPLPQMNEPHKDLLQESPPMRRTWGREFPPNTRYSEAPPSPPSNVRKVFPRGPPLKPFPPAVFMKIETPLVVGTSGAFPPP